ncbi:hypothetical protein LGQ03_07190 [Loktanella sp. TSTF-M6]|uniref:Uncharacterized protein n=1 Tax=Loktanella gaetbuli TaxID=2881335 RepID=A0ABS8BTG4_9RHOB|nr:hypothetical protein [Loktanella gaetbuli]MCB5199020.1 hypothetical protein [Loktanella gaetbuli]
MSDILAAIERAHEDRKNDRVKVHVPAWGVDLWFPRHITLARKDMINKGIRPDDESALIVNFVLHQAQNEDGTQAFKVDAISRATLTGKATAAELIQIMQDIGTGETVPEAKNA